MPRFGQDGSFYIEPLAMFNTIVKPSFEDLLPEGDGAFDGFMNDFTVMDNVPYHRPIIDIMPKYNILMRRDASCDIVYKKIGSFGMRDIQTVPLYAGTKMCKTEFYQGALQNFRDKDAETFGKFIVPFFMQAARIDMATNVWFGDINRTNLSSYQFSTTAFPGVFRWIASYVASGEIPAAQTFVPAATDYRDPAHYQDAFNAIVAAYRAMPVLMRAMPNAMKIMYVDQPVLDGYREYMKQLGTTSDVITAYFNNEPGSGKGGIQLDAYNGIAIVPVPLWEPVLNDLNGGTGYHHSIILTIRKNFIFATDKNYGEGEELNASLSIWYFKNDLSWYYQQFLKAGVQIAVPSMVVVGVSA